MSFFNFRRAGSTPANNAATAAQPDSVEVIRKRAKHRLIGASVLVLAGIIGFPLLFDTQPRPIAVDIPIEIPNKNAVKPLPVPARLEAAPATPSAPAVAPPAAPVVAAVTPPPAVAAAPVAAAKPASASEKVAASASLAEKEEVLADKRPVTTALSASPAIKKEAKPAPKVEVKPAPAADDGARARALLNGQTAAVAASASAPAAAEGRMVVQVGAYSDAAKAREARLKLEKAGFKTYTQVAETKDGKRIRVRVGPFGTKAEADKAAVKIKSLDLPAAVLTL